MKNFLVIADQDRGKSYFIKNEILKKFHSRKNFIYDVNLEYLDFKNEIPLNRFVSKDEFLNTIPLTTHPPSSANVIFEESTGFFSRAGVTESSLMLHIYRRFHSKNINVFVFHGLEFVPLDILPSIDFIVLFRTSDNPTKIEKKFTNYPKILNAYFDIQEKTKNTFFDRIKKTYPDEHSKNFFHYKRVISTKS